MKQINSYDYENFIGTLIENLKRDTDTNLVPDYGGDIPEFPFTTYSFVNPHIDIAYSKGYHSIFDIVVSFTTQSNHLLECLTASSKVMNWFKDREVQQELAEQGISVFQIFDQTQLDNPFPIDTVRRAVFEVRFRVVNADKVDNSTTIDEIIANNGEIDVKKKGN